MTTRFRPKILSLAIATAVWGASPAQAELVAGICEVNGINACQSSGVEVPPSGVITLRGYAFDLETKDRPVAGNGSHLMVRNEDTLQVYRLPIERTEARPDVVGPHLTAITPDQYEMVNAGFIAQVFMASLPAGVYSVREVNIHMTESSFVKLPLDANNKATFTVGGAAASPFRLVKPDGSVLPLSMLKSGSNVILATGYPALRDGAYRIEAQLPSPSGVVQSAKDFNYRRPVLEVISSIPAVENFPGMVSRIVPTDPLTRRPLSLDDLPVILDEVSGQITLNGAPVSVGHKTTIHQDNSLSGVFNAKFNDVSEQISQQTVKLFVNLPDAPHLHVKINRWDPAEKITATPSKTTASIRVEEIDVDNKLKGGSPETCQALVMVRPEYTLQSMAGVTCAIKYTDLPEGMKYNPYRSNALRGAVPAEGDNLFGYLPGVIYTDPETRQTAFYPAKAGGRSVLVTGLLPAPINLSFIPDKALSAFYKSSGEQYPGKHFAQVDPAQARLLGRVNVKAAHRNVVTRVVYPDSSSRDHYSSIPESNVTLAYASDTPWQSYPVKVESWYEKAPDLKTEQTYEFVGVPMPPSIHIDRGGISHDQADTHLTGKIGIVKGQGLVFDAASMGKWRVHVVSKEGEPMSEPAPVANDGGFDINLGTLTPATRYVHVVAQMIDGTETVVPHEIVSRQHVLITAKGDLIEGSLLVRNSSGKAPFVQTIYLDVKDDLMLRDVGKVFWERETAPDVWERIKRDGGEDYSGMSYVASLNEPSTVRYRAVVVNRHSMSEFTTEPMQLQSFDLPNFRLVAPAAAVINRPVTLNIEAEPGFEAEYTWKFLTTGGYEAVSGTTGDSLTFTPTELKGYIIEVRGRQIGAPDTEQSSVKKTISIRAVNPLIARASIEGPTHMEVGKTYHLTARINDVVPGSTVKSYEVKGYWSLPDGTRVDGLELDYTPKAGETALSYLTYVDGYPEETSVSVHNFRTWEYHWPTEWRVRLQPVYLDVPASIKYVVEPVNFDLRTMNGEPLTYTWSMPTSVSRAGGDTSGTLSIEQQGSYQVAVQVADTRGNVVNITSDQFSILPPATVKTQMAAVSKYGEAYYAPGTYYVSAKVIEVPRGDRFLKHELLVNGEKVGEFTGSGHYVTFAQAGTYDVVLRTLTKLGGYGEQTATINVQAAPTPTCQINQKTTTSGLYIEPKCAVEVGYIKSYLWTYDLDGGAQKATSKTFMALKDWIAKGRISNLQLTVESDLGAKATEPVPIPH